MKRRNLFRPYAVAIVLASLNSCINPSEAYVRADVETYKLVSPQLRTYLDGDLSIDSASRAVYH
jgi:hypothetical protein